MRTYGSSITLIEGVDESRALSRAKGYLHTLQGDDLDPLVDRDLLKEAKNLDQLFAAFGLVLRRQGDEKIIGASSATDEWVNQWRLFEALTNSIAAGSWYAYNTGHFDQVIIFEADGPKEHFYMTGTLDVEEGPYFEYPHGFEVPDPGDGDRLDQQTRMVQHWHHTVTLDPCKATSLTSFEAQSFIADAKR